MDYAIPKAEFLPPFELDRTETPTDVNPLGVKGAGETGDDRLDAGGRERGRRRARAARDHAPRHAADAGARLAGDRAGEGWRGGAMYTTRPAEFELPPADDPRRGGRAARRADDSRPLAGGHSLLPAMKLRLSRTGGARRHRPGSPGWTGSSRTATGSAIGALATHASVAASEPVRSACPVLAETARADRRPAGAQPRHDRRQPRARRSRRRLPDRRDGARGDDHRRRAGRRAGDRGRRLLHRHLRRPRSSPASCHGGARAAAPAGTGAAYVKHAPPGVRLRGRRRRRGRARRGRHVHGARGSWSAA